jgi:hypothetical protein
LPRQLDEYYTQPTACLVAGPLFGSTCKALHASVSGDKATHLGPKKLFSPTKLTRQTHQT